MRRIVPALGCLAVTTHRARRIEASSSGADGIEFYRQLNHFGQLIEQVARRQVAGDVDGARLALDMHHLAQLHHWLRQHGSNQDHRHDFESAFAAYEQVCDFERAKVGLLSSGDDDEVHLRHIYTGSAVNPLINTLSVMESNLTDLESELSKKRQEINSAIDHVKNEHLDEQLETAQMALEQWHHNDHSVEGFVRRQNEQDALNAMAKLAKGGVGRARDALHEQFLALDEKAANRFASVSIEATSAPKGRLTLNDVFFDLGIDHVDTLTGQLERKITEHNYDTTVSLDKMNAHTEQGALLYLLENFAMPSEDVLKLIIDKTRSLSSLDGSIKAILDVLETHREHYFIEDDLRLILATCQRETAKWAHLDSDEPPTRAYTFWLALTNNGLGNPYTLICNFSPKTHNQYILSMLNPTTSTQYWSIIDIVRLLNNLNGLSRCSVQTWLNYARSHLAVLQVSLQQQKLILPAST